MKYAIVSNKTNKPINLYKEDGHSVQVAAHAHRVCVPDECVAFQVPKGIRVYYRPETAVSRTVYIETTTVTDNPPVSSTSSNDAEISTSDYTGN